MKHQDSCPKKKRLECKNCGNKYVSAQALKAHMEERICLRRSSSEESVVIEDIVTKENCDVPPGGQVGSLYSYLQKFEMVPYEPCEESDE